MAAHSGRTVQDLADSMSSPELTDWIAFDRLYGYPDIYFLAAALGPAIAGPWSKEPPRAEDFVPFFAPDGPRQDVNHHRTAFAAMAARSRK